MFSSREMWARWVEGLRSATEVLRCTIQAPTGQQFRLYQGTLIEEDADGDMEPKKTRDQFEPSISRATIQFAKDIMGRGLLAVRSHLIDDMVLIRLKNVPMLMEISLAEIRCPHQDRDLIKQTRTELLAPGRTRLESVIQELTGFRVESLHTDINAVRGSGLSSSL